MDDAFKPNRRNRRLGEASPTVVDLTRVDLQRGALQLPRTLQGVIPQGDLEVVDGASGETLSLHFRPPRELSGLGGFFAAHELRPNDAVAVETEPTLKFTPVRRERREPRGPAREAAKGKAAQQQPAPPQEAKRWQSVLYEPKPAAPRQEEDAAPPAGLSRASAEAGERSAAAPLRPETAEPRRPEARRELPQPSAPREAPEAREAVREPVAVPAARQEAERKPGPEDLQASVTNYLHHPDTPTIVRAETVAEALERPLNEVQEILAGVARRSEGEITAIRQGVYLIKRRRS